MTKRTLFFNMVSVVTIASLLTGCCGLCEDLGPTITIDLGGGDEDTWATGATEPEEPFATEIPLQPLGEQVEIISDTEFTPAEALERLEGDQDFAAVYTLASEQGYTQAETAGEIILTDGTVVTALLLSSPQGGWVAPLHLQKDRRSRSLLARAEGETLVLYDANGLAEITQWGVRVFDATGSPIGEAGVPQSRRPPAVASPLRHTCDEDPEEPSWADFDHCCRNWIASGSASTAACAVTLAGLGLAIATGGWAIPVAIAAVLAACGYPYHCEWQAMQDDPPTAEAQLPDPVQGETRVECGERDGQQGVVTFQQYKVTVKVSDDRTPRVGDQTYYYWSGQEGSEAITDCAGNTTQVGIKNIPDPTFQPCDELEECDFATAQCVPLDIPLGEPTPPLGTGDLSFRLQWTGTADLDLHVIDPNGEEIYYENQTSTSGGQLDRDDHCEPTAHGGPENIYWPTGRAPRGEYTVKVVYYSQCSEVPEGPQRFMVAILADGVVKWSIDGILNPEEERTLRTFVYPLGL